MKNKKSLGQYWLKNREILETIAELAVEVDARCSVCVEIGPGLGMLTSSLLKRFEKVIAVELDRDLAEKLPRSFPRKNLEVVNEDILKFDFLRAGKDFAVAGNIPYYITSPIVERLLNLAILPRKIVLLVQKEVAERITAEKESVLSLMVKNRAKVELGPVVLRTEFRPEPKVDSRVVVLWPHKALVTEEVTELIRRGFRAPRKKLVHNLAGAREAMMRVGINENARAEELHLRDWERLNEGLREAV